MRRRAPRGLAQALEHLVSRVAPQSTLGDIQRVWERTVGPELAQRAEPVAERDGTLTVACESAVWAQELELLGPELVGQLNSALGRPGISALRCRATKSAGALHGFTK